MDEMEKKKIIYDAISDQIKREDNLVSNRIGWFLTSQGFLLAALAVIIGSELKTCTKEYAGIFFAVVGGFISVFVMAGVHGAQKSLDNLRGHWEKIESDFYFFPPPYGKKPAWTLGRIPRLCIPILLLFAWIAIVVGVLVIPLDVTCP